MDAKKLESLGVSFFLSFDVPGGATTIQIAAEQLAKLETDPVGVRASALKMTKPEYCLWIENDGAVICSGKTTKGKPCKNIVAGGSQLDAKTWKDRLGEYCVTHGGPHAFELKS